MGDRTYVKLSLPKACLNKAENVIPDIEGNNTKEWLTPCDNGGGVEMITFGYEEIDDAILGFEEVLMENKIPFNKEWEDGANYNAGEDVFRIGSNGEGVIKQFEPVTFDMIPLFEVKEAAKDGMKSINELLKKYDEKFSFTPWKEQMEILPILES